MKTDELYNILYHELVNIAPQSRFYSIREIMRRFSVNQRAAVKVIRILEKKGFVECRPHIGIFCTMKNSSFKRRLLFLALDWPSPILDLWKEQLRKAAEKSGKWILHSVSSPSETPIPKIAVAGYDAVCINRPAVQNREYMKWLLNFNIPVVLTGCRTGDFHINTVNGMDEFSGNILAKYLYDRGHRQVLLFNSEPENSCIRLRKEGFCNMAELLGMQVIQLDCHTSLGEFSLLRGYEYLRGCIEEYKGKFSAVFMTTSSMASGVYKALREHGLRIPEDISVVGCDRSDPGGIDPPLTRIQYPESPEETVLKQLESLFAGEIDCFHTEIRTTVYEGSSVKKL
ncbi:MAG: substrate-binding domain-containing protein [Lentisphaeria bacterium]|nr:substrate-binding domain-containing protein [Lentisphaeria bacterium]